MLLSNILNPDGPKSNGHYTVLHFESKSELVTLPKSYQDLENEVKTLYNIDPGQFVVETDSLNVCCGKRILVPSAVWDDVASLLGNLYIVVPDSKGGPVTTVAKVVEETRSTVASQVHPSSPKPTPDHPSTAIVHSANQGLITLGSPFVKNEILVVSLGDVYLGRGPIIPASCNFQILEKNGSSAVTITISPGSGKTVFATLNDSIIVNCSPKDIFSLYPGHYITVFKQKMRFVILYDGHFIASMNGPSHKPLTSVMYHFGNPSLFEGPITGTVFASFNDIAQDLAPSEPVFATMGRDALYEQILACNPVDAENILSALAAIRGESDVDDHPGYGADWTNQQIPGRGREWTEFVWDYRPRSMILFRFTNGDFALRSWGGWCIEFGDLHHQHLRIGFESSNQVHFEETGSKFFSNDTYHNVTLSGESLRSPGFHTVALVNHDGKLHVVFDFKTATVSPRDTLLKSKPATMRCLRGGDLHDPIVDLDVYYFG